MKPKALLLAVPRVPGGGLSVGTPMHWDTGSYSPAPVALKTFWDKLLGSCPYGDARVMVRQPDPHGPCHSPTEHTAPLQGS